MHRSGTSCLTGNLRSYNVYLSDNQSKLSADNAKGNMEDPRVYKLNDRLLSANKYKWYRPPLSKDDIISNENINEEIQDYKKKLCASAGDLVPMIKDPRMLFCFKHWYAEGDFLIGTFRHPSAVVRSLKLRNEKLDKPLKAEWLRCWIRYNRALLKLHDIYKFPLLNFDLERNRYLALLDKASKEHLKLHRHHDAKVFYDNSLIHQKAEEISTIDSSYARDIYNELMAKSEK